MDWLFRISKTSGMRRGGLLGRIGIGAQVKLPQRLLIGVAAVGALVHVGILFPTGLALFRAVPADARPVIVAVSGSLIIAVIACALAMLLVVRAGTRYEARGLALFLVLIAVNWGAVLRFASLDRGPDGTPTGLSFTVGGTPLLLAVLTLALASAALLSLSMRFPHDLTDGGAGRWSLIRRPWVPWALAVATPTLIRPGVSIIGRGARALGMEAETMARLLPWVLGTVATIIGSLVLGMVALAIANFVRGYRLADEEARRSALWLLLGMVGSAFLVMASTFLLALDIILPVSLGLLSRYTPLIVLFAPLVMVICVAVAVLYSGAVDPRLALRRSTINGFAGTFGLLVFAGLENTLSAWFESRLGLPGAVGSFLAGAISAGVILPVRRILGRSRVVSATTGDP